MANISVIEAFVFVCIMFVYIFGIVNSGTRPQQDSDAE